MKETIGGWGLLAFFIVYSYGLKNGYLGEEDLFREIIKYVLLGSSFTAVNAAPSFLRKYKQRAVQVTELQEDNRKLVKEIEKK